MTNTLSNKYFELGDAWWKQIIDGCYQHHGKMVFDKGLHGGHIEPGYLKGVETASRFAVEALATHNLTVALYKQIQAIACSHFNRLEDSGTPGKEAIGTFRPSGNGPRSTVVFKKWSKGELPFPGIDRFLLLGFLDRGLRGDKLISEYNYCKDESIKPLAQGPLLDRFIRLHQEWKERVETFGRSTKIPSFEREIDVIFVDYRADKYDFDKGTQDFLEAFNAQIDAAGPEEKLRLVAKLFQDLDWQHAFLDGQGRTDLIVLNVLLCKYGFNPGILDEPYFATYHTLDEWVVYLKEGMEAWRRELATS